MFLRVAVLPVGLALAGCPAELEPADVDPDCTPQYEPTFDNVYANTLEPECSPFGCHNGPNARGDLDLATIDVAYAALLEEGEGRVLPGDPEHSEMVMRIFTSENDFRMPPGPTPLPAEEQCAVALWVLMGAER
jgi:hypothetical protein